MSDLTFDKIFDIVNNNNDNNNNEENELNEETNNNIKLLDYNDTDNFINNKYFSDLFGEYVIRTSVINSSNNSLFASVLYLVDDDFVTFDKSEQLKYINVLKKKIRSIATEKKLLTNLKLINNGWNKKNLIKLLNDDIINFNYIYFLAAYFNINIFLIEENNIYPFYNDDEYTVYKYNFLIFKNNDIYEPIIYIDGSKNLLYNSTLLKNILENDKLKIPETGFNKKNKLKKFLISNKVELYDNNIELNNINVEQSNNTNIEQSEDYYSDIVYSKDELVKLKKKELIDIAKNKKVPYSNKNKAELIENILK